MMECPLLHVINYLDIVCYKPSYVIGLSCRTYLWIYRCCGVFLLFVAVELLGVFAKNNAKSKNLLSDQFSYIVQLGICLIISGLSSISGIEG